MVVVIIASRHPAHTMVVMIQMNIILAHNNFAERLTNDKQRCNVYNMECGWSMSLMWLIIIFMCFCGRFFSKWIFLECYFFSPWVRQHAVCRWACRVNGDSRPSNSILFIFAEIRQTTFDTFRRFWPAQTTSLIRQTDEQKACSETSGLDGVCGNDAVQDKWSQRKPAQAFRIIKCLGIFGCELNVKTTGWQSFRPLIYMALGNRMKFCATIKTTLIFPSLLLVARFVCFRVFAMLASAKQFILALKHFLALAHKFVCLFFLILLLLLSIGGVKFCAKRIFPIQPKRPKFVVISQFGCVKWPDPGSHNGQCDTLTNGRKVAVAFVSLAMA